MRGVEYVADSPVFKQNVEIKTSAKVTYPLPVPDEIKNLIQRMKRYMLHLSGHWIKEYDKFLSKGEIVDTGDNDENYYKLVSLMQKTKVETIARVNNKFDIKGIFINEWHLVVKIEVKGITINTGYSDYTKVNKGMNHIFDLTTAWIFEDNIRKMNSTQYMLKLWEGKEELLERLNDLDEGQIDELMIKHLEEKGHLVLQEDLEHKTDEKVQDTGTTEKTDDSVAPEPEEKDLESDKKVEL
jgi:hypothetical protein